VREMAAVDGQEKRIERQTAYKVSIIEILESRYVKTEGWNPNFILARGEEKISRVNVIGIVLSNEFEQFGQVSYRNITIDDGTGSIALKNFENPDAFSQIGISDVILVIGKPREYGSERYILPEIIKKTDQKWMEQRMLELSMMKKKEEKKPKKQHEIVTEEEIIEKNTGEEKRGKTEMVYSIIKELDTGTGADFEEVIKKAGFPEVENAVKKLLENGDIFEIKAGKLKIL